MPICIPRPIENFTRVQIDRHIPSQQEQGCQFRNHKNSLVFLHNFTNKKSNFSISFRLSLALIVALKKNISDFSLKRACERSRLECTSYLLRETIVTVDMTDALGKEISNSKRATLKGVIRYMAQCILSKIDTFL